MTTKAKDFRLLNTKLAHFEKWLAGLSDLDRMNFKALINFPNAAEMIAKLPEGQYREMATLGFAVIQQQKQSAK